ncbi:AI-2E family transporter [Psychromarinibacter sp. S121]|uniref:AI-2E family transporter n=1 Tax=Psychromarinibacter sp. S121 TaxID=3415127 RepID=UPI003C7D045F
MALPANQQLRIWGIAIAVFLVVMWLLGDVILPFVLGGAVAYLLDPIADWLERRGFSRIAATILISVCAVLVFAIVNLAVLPTLVRQANSLIDTFPRLSENLQSWLAVHVPSLMDQDSTIRQSLQSLGEMLKERGAALVETVLSSALSVLNILLLVVIVPVVAFYLLLDWDRMVARIDDLLPRDHAPTIRKLAHDIDKTLASFIRGQGVVMLILGTYYAIALMLAQLQFGLVIGAIAGLLTFIPYVGALVGGALAIGLALFQFWGDWLHIAIIAGIFFSGQFIEGNILTPKLVGDSVGLHPVWLLLALSAFGSLFGFVGMLVAVPVSAALGVLARFAVDQYKQGRLYKGLETQDQAGRD